MEDETGKRQKIEDRISALPENLLVQKLLFLPTEDAMATAMLSKRWRSVWKMLPRLEYIDPYDEGDEGYKTSVWSFLDKSLLQLSKAPVIETLYIHLGPSCPVDADLEKLVDNVVNHGIQWLDFSLLLSSGPRSLSKRLYTCETLKKLTLSDKILVDVPFEASLPSLVDLELFYVVYKDDDLLVRLLSNCPVLQNLFVDRDESEPDNVINFNVKVRSVHLLRYENFNSGGTLVIDCPGLKILNIFDSSGDACLIENLLPCLDMAKVEIYSHPNDKFLRCLSSVMYLNLTWTNEMVAICSAINFSRLIECKLTPFESLDNWVQSVMLLLYNAPELKLLMIKSDDNGESEDLPLGSSVPRCLSSPLEIFEWEEYGGTREEKKLLTYILENSKCLKSVRISLKPSTYNYNNEEKKKKKKMVEELESISRVSESSQLFFSNQFRWRSMKHHPAFQVTRFSYLVTLSILKAFKQRNTS